MCVLANNNGFTTTRRGRSGRPAVAGACRSLLIPAFERTREPTRQCRPVAAACRPLADLRFASAGSRARRRAPVVNACRSLLIPRHPSAPHTASIAKGCRSLLIWPPAATWSRRVSPRLCSVTNMPRFRSAVTTAPWASPCRCRVSSAVPASSGAGTEASGRGTRRPGEKARKFCVPRWKGCAVEAAFENPAAGRAITYARCTKSSFTSAAASLNVA